MLTIKAVSERVGIPASAIRYYEKEGLLPNIQRASGIRQFSEQDIGWLTTICCFLKTGMPLATIRQIVELSALGDDTVEECRSILLKHREDLLVKIDELDHALSVVDAKIGIYDKKAAARTSDIAQKTND